MKVLYVMHEHPSVSQSFVVNEAAAVAAEGLPVVGYALKPGEAIRPAAEIELIAPPPGRARLAVAAFGDVTSAASVVRRGRGLRTRERARLALAEAHAANAAPRAREAGVGHVHAHFLGRTADVAAAVSRRLGCGWSASAHGDDVYAPAEPGLLEMHLKEVEAVACASEDVRAHLAGHAERAGVEVESQIVRCGVDTEALEFRPTGEGTPHVVTIGRLVETKGYLTAVEALTKLMKADPELRWTLIGDGPLRSRIEATIERAGLGDRVALRGALQHQDALRVLVGADAFVLPCQRGPAGDSDGIPVALMEAMALGVPVVTSPVGGIRELVEPGETGYLVEPGDAGELATVLGQVLAPERADERRRIRVAARRKVESDFDQASEARALAGLFRQQEEGPR